MGTESASHQAQHAVLALQRDVHALGDEVARKHGHADAKVAVHAVLQVSRALFILFSLLSLSLFWIGCLFIYFFDDRSCDKEKIMRKKARSRRWSSVRSPHLKLEGGTADDTLAHGGVAAALLAARGHAGLGLHAQALARVSEEEARGKTSSVSNDDGNRTYKCKYT
jgi:hypothetical protein